MAIIEKYNKGGIKIYHSNCMEAMAEMPDKAFELAITDPPYGLQSGNSISNGGGLHSKSTVKFGSLFKMMDSYNNKKWDTETPSEKYFDELKRVSKNWIIWGANYFNLPPCRGFIVWDKIQTLDNFSACELAYTSFNMPSKIYKYAYAGFIGQTMKRIHPTEKPHNLYEWLLVNFAKSGDKILDTHLGSGSSAIAAYNLGFDFTGFELDEEYVDGAVKRLVEHQLQMKIFDNDIWLQNTNT